MFPLNNEKLVFNEDLMAENHSQIFDNKEKMKTTTNLRGCSSIESSFK